MVDRQCQRDIAADWYRNRARRTAVLADRDNSLAGAPFLPCRETLGQVLDPDLHWQFFSDQPKARRLSDDERSISFIGSAGEKHMERPSERFGSLFCIARRNVVHLPV